MYQIKRGDEVLFEMPKFRKLSSGHISSLIYNLVRILDKGNGYLTDYLDLGHLDLAHKCILNVSEKRISFQEIIHLHIKPVAAKYGLIIKKE